MTARRDPDRLIRTYLEDGPTELADRSYDAVRAQIEQARQRVVFGPLRAPDMSKFASFAIAAAAVLIVVAVIGYYFVPRGGQIGGPGPTSVPVTLGPGETPLEPGTYTAVVAGYRYTISVEAVGWVSNVTGTDWEIKSDPPASVPNFAALHVLGTVPGPVQVDGCQWGRTIPSGETVDDLASPLAAVEGFETSGPSDVVVDGHSGKRVVMTVPDNVSLSACRDGDYRNFADRALFTAGQVDDVRILDLDGARLVFLTTHGRGTLPETREQLEQIAESLQIERVGD